MGKKRRLKKTRDIEGDEEMMMSESKLQKTEDIEDKEMKDEDN